MSSAVAVGVSIDRDLEVRSAGGYMVQVLPFASDETISALERTIPSLPSTTDMIADGATAKEMAEKVLGELGTLPEVGLGFSRERGAVLYLYFLPRPSCMI